MTDVIASDEPNYTVYAEHQHVLCKIVPWSGMFESAVFAAPDQTVGTNPDKTIVMEVVCSGPGNISRGTLNECNLSKGDLVVANLFHRTHEVRLLGDNFSMVNWENVMAKVHVDELSKGISMAPLQSYIVTRVNEDAARKIILGTASTLYLPGGDSQYTGGGDYDARGKPHVQMKTVIEEVVQVGPGCVIDGAWQEPPQLAGDLVMYDTSVSPVKFVAGGQSFTLVHYRHCLLTFRAGAENVELPPAG